MCGICGIATRDPGRPVDTAVIGRMTNCLAHRGPDGEGIHAAPGVGLGVRRLAIVDPETGDQPISNEDGTVTVICNGEIYNAAELRRALERRGHSFRTGSDVEVVIHLYEERGDDCLGGLSGMFALALWDASERRLLLARDGVGMKPLVWAETRTGIAFASESKAFFAAGLLEPEIDPVAVDALFRFGYVVSPRTAFREIRALLPGHRLAYREGALRIESWWRLPEASGQRPERAPRRWAMGLRERLEESVRAHLRSDAPVSTWLSGGLDSSIVTALAARASASPVDVHTLRFDDPTFDEGSNGALVQSGDVELREHSSRLGDEALEWFPRAMWHAESPTTNMGELPRWVLAEGTSRTHRVVLAGEGSDEIFGGYEWYRLDRWARPLSRLPRRLRRAMLVGPLSPPRRPWAAAAILAQADDPMDRFEALTGLRDRNVRHTLYAAEFQSRLTAGQGAGPCPADALVGALPKGTFERLQYAELKIRLPDFVEVKLDRMSMAHGVEVRLPFLDPEVLCYAAEIPASLKLRRGTEKWILRLAAEGLLPDTLRWRAKRGLAVPYRRWLRGPLPAFAAELLSPRALERKGFFDPREVQERLKRHRAGVADHANALVGILAVQTLDEVFVASAAPGKAPST